MFLNSVLNFTNITKIIEYRIYIYTHIYIQMIYIYTFIYKYIYYNIYILYIRLKFCFSILLQLFSNYKSQYEERQNTRKEYLG